jgi:hypothetical protein
MIELLVAPVSEHNFRVFPAPAIAMGQSRKTDRDPGISGAEVPPGA